MSLHRLVVRFFRGLSRYAIRHPQQVLVVAAVVTIATAPGVLRLKLRTDGHALVSPSAPEVVYDRSVRDTFGLEDQIVVLIRSQHPDGIFNRATLRRVRDLTEDFGKIPGLNPSNLVSLATESSFRVRPGSMVREKLLEPPLQTKPELDRLRDDLRQIELYTGTLVSFDGQSTAILIGAAPRSDRTQLYGHLLEIITAQGPIPEDIAVTGAPVAEALLGIHILEDLGVPHALLGTSTWTQTERAPWKFPASLYELRLFIARHIGLVPIVAIVMALIFYLSFRNLLATLLPMPEVAATLLFTFGLMGWLNVPVYLTIAVMPVLLTAMCVTDEIHVFSRYFTLLREKPGVPHVELVQETADEMACPVANTTLTTAIGFVSFAFSPLAPVQAFGIFTAVGVLFSLFYSLTVVPATLTLLNPAWLMSRRRKAPTTAASLTSAWFGRLALAVVRHRYWVLGAVVAVTALAPLGLRRLVIQDSWIDGFDPGSEFRRATRLVNEQFQGMHLLCVTVDATKVLQGELPSSAIGGSRIVLPTALVENPAEVAGSWIKLSRADDSKEVGTSNTSPRLPWQSHIEMATLEGGQLVARTPKQDGLASFAAGMPAAGKVHFEINDQTHVKPDIVQAIASLAAFIRERRQYAVGGVLSPADYIATTRFMVRPHEPNSRVVPNDAGEIKLMWDYYRIVRGPERLRQLVDTNYSRSLTTIFLKDANFMDTAKLMRDIRAYEREHLTPRGLTLGFAGDVAVSQSLIMGIVTTQLQSLFWSLVGISAVTSLLGRSWRWGIYCVLPSALAVVINFAVMGWFNVPLGVATSMFAGMTLGIGVDFAIHVLEGFGQARADGRSQTEALSVAMEQTGPPVLINTVAVSLGFGVLMLSQVPANARLGLLVVLGLVDCLIASLLLLPALLHWWPLHDPPETPPQSPPLAPKSRAVP